MTLSIRNFDPSTITPTPTLPDTHGTTWDNSRDKLLAAGWRKVADYPDLETPEGQRFARWEYEQDEEREEYAVPVAVYEEIPPEPEPTPERFPAGIDAPLLVLDTPDGKGVGYVAGQDGELIPVVYAHESPYDVDALASRIAQARSQATEAAQARAGRIRAAVDDADKAAGAASAAGNSIPALRKAVADLAATVKSIVKELL